MIRRISKHNDLKDYIKSCPSGVIDDIYKVEYYIQGYNTVIECGFIKSGELLEVTLPTSLLGTLQNGILMRRAYYKVVDSSYPDGYYNLEFEDCMNIWLGDYESEEPIIPEYVTEDELVSELTSYATKDWVDSQQFLTSETIPSDIATQSWVSSNFLGLTALTGYATQSWVENQGYLTSHQDLSSYATQSWVSSNFLSSTALTGYATQSWVSSQQFLTSDSLSDYMTESAIENLGFATESWVLSQGYITVNEIPSGLATQSWVSSNFLSATALTGYATESWVISQSFAKQSDVNVQIRNIEDYLSLGIVPMISSLASEIGDYSSIISDIQGSVTEVYSYVDEQIEYVNSWIDDQNYASEQFVTNSLSGYATESWVSSNFLSSGALSGYATEQFVTSSLSGYATESWVSSNFLSSSTIWVGTMVEWVLLTSEEKEFYTIALIKE